MIKQPNLAEIKTVLRGVKPHPDLSEPEFEKAVDKQAARIMDGARTLRRFDKQEWLERQQPAVSKQIEPIRKALLKLSKLLSDPGLGPAAISFLGETGLVDLETEEPADVADRLLRSIKKHKRGTPSKEEARAIAQGAKEAFRKLTDWRGSATNGVDYEIPTPFVSLVKGLFELFGVEASARSMAAFALQHERKSASSDKE